MKYNDVTKRINIDLKYQMKCFIEVGATMPTRCLPCHFYISLFFLKSKRLLVIKRICMRAFLRKIRLKFLAVEMNQKQFYRVA